ncbi:peptidase M22 [Acetobacter aceti 1023]|nr:peptidase M22 [Acetobacter aceti 1023]
MMVQRILVLDGSPAGESACGMAACVQVEGDKLSVLGAKVVAGKQAAEGINLLADAVLQKVGWGAGTGMQPDLVAVVVGPGSFTGLRASCAVAAGFALGADCPLVGVTRAEALAPALDQELQQHPECKGWLVITPARRGRVFVEDAQQVHAVMIASWHQPEGKWLVAGAACKDLSFSHAIYSGLCSPTPEQIACAALKRQQDVIPPRDPLPLYVDPPEAKLPAQGLRAKPV